MRVIVTSLDSVYSVILFRGHGKDLRLIAKIPPGGKYESPPEEAGASDLYWADSTRIDIAEAA